MAVADISEHLTLGPQDCTRSKKKTSPPTGLLGSHEAARGHGGEVHDHAFDFASSPSRD